MQCKQSCLAFWFALHRLRLACKRCKATLQAARCRSLKWRMGDRTAPTGFALVGPGVAAGMLLVQGSPSGIVLSPRNQPNASLALCFALLMRRKRGVSAGAHA